MMLRSPALSAAAALALALLAVAAPALANGRYPAAGQIVVDPADPETIVVRATYGVLTTRDRGKRWSWICEASIGYGGSEDPMLGITKDGSMLAGTFQGLSVTHDRGCQWDMEQGGLTSRYVIDLSVERADPSSAILLISNSIAQNTFLTQVWQAPDNGKTWTVAGVALPAAFLGLTVDSAPSDPQRIYVSGRDGAPDYLGYLQRSKDRGQIWEKFLIPGADDTHLAYIGAVDPNNAEVVYVRLDGDNADSLKVSKDGGQSWAEVFTPMSMLGFAVSPDGKRVAAGSDKDGLWTAPADTLAFTKVSNVGVRCLTWTPQGLYACANEFIDGFTAGVSTDEGKTWTPIMHLQQLCGPLQCDPMSSTGKLCPPLWGTTSLSIGNAGCGADGGTDGVSSASSGTGSGGGDSSCACSALGASGSSVLGGISILSATLLFLTRRKKR